MTTPTGILFSDPQAKPLSTVGLPQAGAYLIFYLTGTTTPAVVYADGLLTTPLSQVPGTSQPSCTADSAGRFNPIYMNPSVIYRVQLFTALGSKLEDTDPYVVTGPPTAAQIGAALFPLTGAETAVSVVPTTFIYPEGDIRRYGATIGATDNSTAINDALAVSGAGGNAAFIPGIEAGSSWNITTALSAVNSCSMYGVGQASTIVCSGCDGIIFSAQGAYEGTRFFRDFVLKGSSATSSTNNGINIGTALSSGRLTGIQFSNLTILNFAKAVYVNNPTGIWNSSFTDCFLYNNYQGYYFNGQVEVLSIRGGFVQCGSMAGNVTTGNGTRYGLYTNANSGGDVQSLHLQSMGFYAYDVNIYLHFTVYVAIADCDISVYGTSGIEINAAQGGTFIKSCWIQAAANGTNQTGIAIDDLASAINDKIVIDSCQLEGQTGTGSASLGIYCGENNTAVSILNSTIGTAGAPFANGIAGIGGYIQAPNVVIKNNTFYVVNSGVCISIGNADGLNIEVGPNVIQNASSVPVAFSAGTAGATPLGFRYFAPGMKGTKAFSSSTSAAVTFTGAAMPNASYFVMLGGNAAGYAWSVSNATTGFTIDCSASNSNSVDWSISYY